MKLIDSFGNVYDVSLLPSGVALYLDGHVHSIISTSCITQLIKANHFRWMREATRVEYLSP